MNPRRVGILLGKELVHGPKNFVFIMALVVPVVISLVASLLFGTLFADKPKLGIADEGDSQMARLAAQVDSLIVQKYTSTGELRQAVETGAVDLGIALPQGFDGLVVNGEKVRLLAYVWGESLLKHRAILGTTIVVLVREIAGQESPVEIVTTTLGDAESVPWEERLLPFIVLLAIVVGGSMVPATSLVDEKQKRTLGALTVTPASLGDVFLTKGLLGAILSLFMGVLTLVLNRAFGGQPLLLLLLLSLGAIVAAAFGVLLGALVKDVNTLFATFKSIGVILYAPALIYLFPGIPQWIARIFPTYYIIAPIIEVSQRGGDWSDVAPQVVVLVGIILALFGVVAVVARRMRQQEI
jgi:ABC-2 type transport system permease protein